VCYCKILLMLDHNMHGMHDSVSDPQKLRRLQRR
jgi:hypothetical protein